MNKLKKLYHDVQEVIAWISIFFLLFVLVMAVSLTCMRAAKAEEIYSLPLAQVRVNADSHLNIRRTPGGEIIGHQLFPRDDVAILATYGEWAWIIRAEDVDRTDMRGTPLGWVHMDYLLIYNVHLTNKKGPQLQPWAGMIPDLLDQQQYITIGGPIQ